MAVDREVANRRVRRTPEVARREILDAARRVLESDQPQDFSVSAVMNETAMTRKAFYVHFADRGELIRALVQPLRAELDEALGRWSTSADPVAGGAAALAEAARLYIGHNRLLRAVWSPGAGDQEVADARVTLVEPLVTTGAALLRTRRGFDAERARSVASVLAAMNVQALLALGPAPAPGVTESTLDAIQEVWTSVILRDGPIPRS